MKEQRLINVKAKSLYVQERMEPIKIHIVTPPMDIKQDDCYNKIHNFLKVCVLVLLLLILSWIAVTLYSKSSVKEVTVDEKFEQFVNNQDNYEIKKNSLLQLNDITTQSIKSVKSLESDRQNLYKILRNDPDSIIFVDGADLDELKVPKQMIVKREAVKDPAPAASSSGLKKESTGQEKKVIHILPGVTLPALMAKHLEPIVGPNFELLDWYYRCKAHPELEKTKGKLHVATAKWLFGSDITSYKKDSDVVADLLMDEAYTLELREIIENKIDLTPQTPVQHRIVDIIMSRAKLDSEVQKMKIVPSWINIGLEGLNAETLKNFYFKKKEIAAGCKTCNKEDKMHLENLKNLVDRFSDSSEESDEKSSAGTKLQFNNEALESLNRLKKVAAEKVAEQPEKKSS